MSNQDSGNPAAKPPKGKTAARRKARSLAVQALYSWQIAGQPLHEIEAQFRTDNDFSEVDGAYFHEILHGVPRQKSELDSTFEPCLDRPLAEIDPGELAILRLSTYELRNRIDVPYKVVINEGIELAKTFGATDGHSSSTACSTSWRRACAPPSCAAASADPAPAASWVSSS